ncbi:MAG: twitching motility protein PilT [Lachnospiraceae bacterium]|nr:twitching motility protein PilT [Lachnospiraceae bacterium]
MIELIVGEKGTGKTKILLAKANDDVKDTGGNLVYLDINNKHMYELSHRIRLLNVQEFNIHSSDMFLGFIYGIASQDYDIDKMFLDNFTSISCADNIADVEKLINELSKISEKFEIDFIISLSAKKDELPESLSKLVTSAL